MTLSTYTTTDKIIDSKRNYRDPIDFINMQITDPREFSVDSRINLDGGYVDILLRDFRANKRALELRPNLIPFVSLQKDIDAGFTSPSNFSRVEITEVEIEEETHTVLRLFFVEPPSQSGLQLKIDYVILFEHQADLEYPIVGMILGVANSGLSFSETNIDAFVDYFEYMISQYAKEEADRINSIFEEYTNYMITEQLVAATITADRLLIDSVNLFGTFDTFEEWKGKAVPYKVGSSNVENNTLFSASIAAHSEPITDLMGESYFEISSLGGTLLSPTTGSTKNTFRKTGNNYELLLDDYFVIDIVKVFNSPLENYNNLVVNKYYYFEYEDKLYKYVGANTLVEMTSSEVEIKKNKVNFVGKSTNKYYYSTDSSVLYEYKQYGPVLTEAEAREVPIRPLPIKVKDAIGYKPWIKLPSGHHIISWYAKGSTNGTTMSIRLYDEHELRFLDHQTTVSNSWDRYFINFYIPEEKIDHLAALELVLQTAGQTISIDNIQIERIFVSSLESAAIQTPSSFSRGGRILFDGGSLKTGSVKAEHAVFEKGAIGSADIAYAVILDAHIHSLSASKIITGILDAKVVDVIDLNAHNITTGQLSAERLLIVDPDNPEDSLLLQLNSLAYEPVETHPSGGIPSHYVIIENEGGVPVKKYFFWDEELEEYTRTFAPLVLSKFDGSNIERKTISADQLNVRELSAIVANLGEIDTGKILHRDNVGNILSYIDLTNNEVNLGDKLIYKNNELMLNNVKLSLNYTGPKITLPESRIPKTSNVISYTSTANFPSEMGAIIPEEEVSWQDNATYKDRTKILEYKNQYYIYDSAAGNFKNLESAYLKVHAGGKDHYYYVDWSTVGSLHVDYQEETKVFNEDYLLENSTTGQYYEFDGTTYVEKEYGLGTFFEVDENGLKIKFSSTIDNIKLNKVFYAYSPNYDGSDMTLEPQEDTRYMGTFSGTARPLSHGDYDWVRTVGDTGTSIVSVTNYYLAYASDSGVDHSTSGWTPSPQTPTLAKPYLWNYEEITYSNISSTRTPPTIIGNFAKDGETGSQGRGISNVQEKYATSTSNITPPGGTWSDTPVATDPVNKYLWNYEIITYTDGLNPTYTDKRVIGTHGEKGDTGAKGDTGQDGQTFYTWIKYSDNADGTGLYDVPKASTLYIGIAVNKTTPTESTVKTDYTWSKFKGDKGDDGYTPIKGTDYFDGVDGQDGKGIVSAVVRYQNHTNGTTAPTGTWTENPSPIKGQYLWTRTVTTYTEGDPVTTYSVAYQAIDGTDGTDGRGIVSTVVDYVKSTTATMPSTGWSTTRPTVNKGEYLWTRTTINYTSGSPSVSVSNSYVPTDGQNGSSAYLWVRYSQNSNGNPMTTSPTNAKYIGVATTSTSPAPDDYNLYSWSLIKGQDGVKGETGQDGQTSYLHIKYSNDGGLTFTGNGGEDVGDWIGTYVDFIEEDSTSVSSYTWNKVKGEQGPQGATGEQGPKGDTGTSVSGVVEWYLATNLSSGVTTSTSGWTTTMQPMTTTKKYLWNYEEINFSDGSSSPTIPVIIGVYGDTGATGRALTGVTEYYLASASASGVTRPATDGTNGWTTTMQTTSVDKPYLWNYEKLTWSVAPTTSYIEPIIIGVHGATGPQGEEGPQGVQGPKGDNGVSQYVHIRYSANSNGNPMTTSPQATTKYIGLANTTSSTAPTGYSSYTWSLIKGSDGEQGPQGLPGEKGENGQPTYTWIKYADTPTSGMSDYPDGKKYIGLAFNKDTSIESEDYNVYKWSLMPQNMELGSRNLVLESDEVVISTSYLVKEYTIGTDFIEDQVYTVVLKGTKPSSQNFGIMQNNGNNGRGNLIHTGDDIYTLTFTSVAPTPGNENSFSIYQPPNDSNVGEVTIEWIKLVVGDTTSYDWAPAPEDVADKNALDVLESRVEGAESELNNLQDDLSENYATKDNLQDYSDNLLGDLKIERDRIDAINSEVETMNASLESITTIEASLGKLEIMVEKVGGSNLIKNSSGHYTTNWKRISTGEIEEINSGYDDKNTVAGKYFLIDAAETYEQSIVVPSGTYIFSCRAKGTGTAGTFTISLNTINVPIVTTNTNWTEYAQEIVLEDSNTIVIKMSSSAANLAQIADMLLLPGTLQQVWIPANGESILGGVKIGESIEITSSRSNIMQKMDHDGNRIINIETGQTVAEYTELGLETKHTKSETAEVAELIFKNMGNQTWITRI